ncbi:MAG TPA: hypothetical protein DF383_12590, partial [Deltaproteobacteria bacterium]|nr:hypothetical protein [Deltaproteobacteria bacterium]
EAEWEKAARGPNGKNEYGTSNGELLDPQGRRLAHFDQKSSAKVGSYPANGYGLFDMAGNAWQWLLNQVLRGGSW